MDAIWIFYAGSGVLRGSDASAAGGCLCPEWRPASLPAAIRKSGFQSAFESDVRGSLCKSASVHVCRHCCSRKCGFLWNAPHRRFLWLHFPSPSYPLSGLRPSLDLKISRHVKVITSSRDRIFELAILACKEVLSLRLYSQRH